MRMLNYAILAAVLVFGIVAVGTFQHAPNRVEMASR